jgi:hypothetical protein
MTKQIINGIEYDVYENITSDSFELKTRHTFLINCTCNVINNMDKLAHVMYKNSSISGRMHGSNKYIVSAYRNKDNYIYAHVFIDNEKSGVPIHKPELLVSVYQTSKY